MGGEYEHRIRQWGESYALIQQASARLKEVLEDSPDEVKANWSIFEDERHQPKYRLPLSDFAGAAESSFDPDELGNPAYMRVRFYHLLAKLLQVRSARQLKEVHRLSGLED